MGHCWVPRQIVSVRSQHGPAAFPAVFFLIYKTSMFTLIKTRALFACAGLYNENMHMQDNAKKCVM